jgi:hypothetical protein
VSIDDPIWYHRRVLRSLKKVFQFRWSGTTGEAVEGAEEVIVEVKRMEGVNCTLRFGRGTRRLLLEIVSEVRRGVCCVWYAQGVRRVGCRRQPIAAVRNVGAAPIMVGRL